MEIINQPFQGQLGEILKTELKKKYTSFTIFSAFAKNSGVLRLKDALEEHKKMGLQQPHLLALIWMGLLMKLY